MSEEMKPCPFCGSSEIKVHCYNTLVDQEPDFFCQCHSCTGIGPNGTDEPSAIAAWNRRAQSSAQLPPLPFAILPEELAALERFHECATDGEGYDVPKEMMRRLAEIGLLRRVTANYYEHTTFGLSVLNDDFASGISAAVPQEKVRGSHIKATMSHDAGAYAQCAYCQRYSDNPRSLSRHSFLCDCGEKHGWSGSFVPPTADSQWSGAAPIQDAAPQEKKS